MRRHRNKLYRYGGAALVYFALSTITGVVEAQRPELDDPFSRPHALIYTGELPYPYARVYGISSGEMTSAVVDVLRGRGIKIDRKGLASGVIISRWFRYSAKRFPRLAPPTEYREVLVRLHLFVPQQFEPARVYVNTEMKVIEDQSGAGGLYYNHGLFENWFYEELETMLGSAGNAIPRDPELRSGLFAKLLAVADSGCPIPSWEEIPEERTVEPRELSFGNKQLMGPYEPRENSTILIEGVIYEDGYLEVQRVKENTTGVKGLEVAVLGKYSLSRFTPGFIGSCSVPGLFLFAVGF